MELEALAEVKMISSDQAVKNKDTTKLNQRPLGACADSKLKKPVVLRKRYC